MSPAESRASALAARPPARRRRTLFWAMLVPIIVLVGVAAVAMSGWTAAINRADMQAARAATLQASVDETAGLQQKVAALQRQVADAQEQGKALQAQLAESKASLAKAQDRAAAAEESAATAKEAATRAEQARVDLQVKLDAAPPPAGPRTDQHGTAPQPASNISAETVQSAIAPDLPLSGLPPGAMPRDYLVVAQQAIREGRSGRAQSALEHAETRLLNQASLTHSLARPASHPGVAEIEQALDQLGDRNTDGALRIIEGLLSRP